MVFSLTLVSLPSFLQEIILENRSGEAILRLINDVLPRHAYLVESLAFGQSSEPLLDDEYSFTDDETNETHISLTPEKVSVIEESERIGGVGQGKEKELPRMLVRARRARGLLIAKVIEMCTNVHQLDCEVSRQSYTFPSLRNYTDPISSQAFQKHPIPEDAYEEDETVMDPTKIYRTDHALEAVVQHLGPKLADFSLLINEDEVSSEADIANVIKHCPNLLRLNLEVYCQSHGNGGRQALHEALLSLNKLETLDIGTPCDFINDEFAQLVLDRPENPYPSLSCLALVECNDLSYPSFISLIERFSQSLRILDIDNTPHANHPRQTKKYLGKPFNLPNLQTLVLSTAHEPKFLQSFINCKLVEFTLGFCPSIAYKDVEDFIIQHSESLVKLEIASDAALTQAQVESLEVFCHAKGISCELLEPDESDGDEEDDPSEFGVDDDDDEGGWYDEDGEEGGLDMVDFEDLSD